MVSKAKERLHKEIRDEAERTARQLRGKFNMGSRDIGDIFRFIEQSLNYLLIRKPFGSEALDGFAAIYQGERLVVTNSSHILAREKFTAAHEIGHHYFDFKDESNDELIADQQTGCFDQQNLAEFRADCFAAALLMPKEGVEDAYNELKLQPGNIAHIDVVRLQIEFGVSYRAMVRRLSDLGKLGPYEDDYLYKYFEETGEGLKPLFRRAQAPSYNMLEAWERVWVPTRYLRCLEANYASGLVSYPVLEKILDIVDVTPEEWDFFPPSKPGADEDIDIDALIKEFSDET